MIEFIFHLSNIRKVFGYFMFRNKEPSESYCVIPIDVYFCFINSLFVGISSPAGEHLLCNIDF